MVLVKFVLKTANHAQILVFVDNVYQQSLTIKEVVTTLAQQELLLTKLTWNALNAQDYAQFVLEMDKHA